MWREEVGITEMILAYIGEFAEFRGWPSWRNVVIDILSCHEEVREKRIAEGQSYLSDLETKGLSTQTTDAEKEEDVAEGISSVTKENRIMRAMEQKIVSSDKISRNDGLASVVDDSTVINENIKEEEEGEWFGESESGANICATGSASALDVSNPDRPWNSFSQSIGDETIKPAISEAFESPSGEGTSYASMTGRTCQPSSVDYSASSNYFDLAVSDESNPQARRRSVGAIKKDHACSFCGKLFERYSYKLRHERSHTGEKPYKCAHCPKTFSQKGNKNFHERSHIKLELHFCTFCGKTFMSKTDRNTHELVHKDFSRFSCSLCGMSFTRECDKLIHTCSMSLESRLFS